MVGSTSPCARALTYARAVLQRVPSRPTATARYRRAEHPLAAASATVPRWTHCKHCLTPPPLSRPVRYRRARPHRPHPRTAPTHSLMHSVSSTIGRNHAYSPLTRTYTHTHSLTLLLSLRCILALCMSVAAPGHWAAVEHPAVSIVLETFRSIWVRILIASPWYALQA